MLALRGEDLVSNIFSFAKETFTFLIELAGGEAMASSVDRLENSKDQKRFVNALVLAIKNDPDLLDNDKNERPIFLKMISL